MANVARSVEMSTRVDFLSWSHRREVASLNPAEEANCQRASNYARVRNLTMCPGIAKSTAAEWLRDVVHLHNVSLPETVTDTLGRKQMAR